MAVKTSNTLPVKTAYDGKYTDRFPDYPTAGKVAFVSDETVAQCLKFPTDKPPTPDPCMRLRYWTTTPVEKHRTFPAQFYDPQLEKARTMIHGVKFPQEADAADLVNPVPKSVYQQRYNDKLESIYESRRMKPLGQCPDPTKHFPEDYNWREATFGIKNTFTEGAKELINPNKPYAVIHQENQADHDTYLKSHKRLYPGEQAKRGYSANPRFQKVDYFGIPTPCNREGLLAKACMRWHTDSEMEKKTPFVDKRLDDFREKYTHQLGLPLDPIKDTMLVGPNHVYGSKSKPDLYKVEDLLHGRIPYYFNTGPNRRRAVMGAIRNHLRSLHYNHYKDLRDACQLLDTENTGLLTEEQTRSLCQQFDLPVDPQLLEQVFDICHENDKINWKLFTDNFNWQERVDFDKYEPDYSYSGDPCESNLADWSIQNRLQREVEREIGNWTTSNSMYNGGGVLKGKVFPALGASTVRTDLPIPKIRKATDRTCYGDEGGARCVVNPSIMTLHGITEMDLLIPRSKAEFKALYDNTCPNQSEAAFDKIWQISNDISNHGPVNHDIFRKALFLFERERIKHEVEKEITMLEGCTF